MHRFAFAVLRLVVLFVAIPASAADPVVVSLWPGKPPKDTGVNKPEKDYIFKAPIVGDTRLITNVTKPTLTVYEAAWDKNTGTAMIICPGGGYWNLFWDLEGEQVARWLNSVGMTGIILKYRCPHLAGEDEWHPPIGPEIDAQRAVSLVRSRAAEWNINPRRIGIVGFSVGGHIALATATGFAERKYEPVDAVDKVSCRPDFAVCCYSGFLKANDKDELWPGLHIPSDTPPVFLTHATDDSIKGAEPENSVIAYLALKRADIPAELHIFATGDHDFGVRQDEKLPSSWPQLCINFLRNQNLLVKPSSPK